MGSLLGKLVVRGPQTYRNMFVTGLIQAVIGAALFSIASLSIKVFSDLSFALYASSIPYVLGAWLIFSGSAFFMLAIHLKIRVFFR